MTRFPALADLLTIRTTDEEIRQKGQLVQILILLLTAVAFVRITLSLFDLLRHGWSQPEGYAFLATLFLAPFFCLGGLLIVRNGRPTLAAHLLFIFLNTAIFLILLQADEPHSYPYLMLISIVAIATMASVKASITYAFLVIVPIAGYYLVRQPTPDYLEDLANYILVTLAVSAAAWITADRMQKWLRQSTSLAAQMETQTNQLERRAQQLQRSALVSQSTANILYLDELLHNMVYTIRDQYGFYFVAIYLLDQNKKNLALREATGSIGDELKARRFRVNLKTQSIIGWAAQNETYRFTHDVQADPFYFRDPLLKETRSELALPLIARGEVMGVLDAQSRETGIFVEEDVAVLQILANQLAVHIDNARLFSQTEAHLNETQTLLNLNEALTSTLDVGEIYRRAARMFAVQLEADRSLITNWDDDQDTAASQIIFTVSGNGRSESDFSMTPYTFPLAHFPNLGSVLKNQNTQIVQTDSEILSQPEQTFLTEMGQHTCLMVPLSHGATPQGLVLIFRKISRTDFTQADIQLAQIMANQTATALNNAMLASEARGRVAELSALNRLSNRLSMAPTLPAIFDGIRREVFSLFEVTTLSIMLLTADKQHFNWAYGYEYGQQLDLSKIGLLKISQGFSGQVLRIKRHLLINKDFAEMMEKYQSVSVGALSAAWLGIPLIVANEVIGVLVVENDNDPNAFSERDIALLETIAGAAAIAINNILQLQEIQAALKAQSEQRLQLETAAEVSATTNSILDLDELLKQAVNVIKDRFSLYYTGIFLSDGLSNQAILKAATGEAGRIQIEKGHRLPIGGRSLIGGATGDGRARITQDVTQDDEWQPNPYLPDTRAELALPLRVRGEIIGALTVQSREPHAFSPQLISILQTMGDQLAVAIDNSRLLTGAENRVQRQRVLNQISTQLHNTSDIDEIVRIGLQALSEQMNGRSVHLSLGKPPSAASQN
ncbi:MAG: GAF domain-containing protein [Chloroflexota bacterium]